jgi:hypothetical protein
MSGRRLLFIYISWKEIGIGAQTRAIVFCISADGRGPRLSRMHNRHPLQRVGARVSASSRRIGHKCGSVGVRRNPRRYRKTRALRLMQARASLRRKIQVTIAKFR